MQALADTFAVHDGVRVLHDTIQYLVQRSEHETEWLDGLAESTVPTTLVWGLYDTISPLRVASYVWLNYLVHKPGDNTFWVLPRANHYLQHDQPDAVRGRRGSRHHRHPPRTWRRARSPTSRAPRCSSIGPARPCPTPRTCSRAPEHDRPSIGHRPPESV